MTDLFDKPNPLRDALRDALEAEAAKRTGGDDTASQFADWLSNRLNDQE